MKKIPSFLLLLALISMLNAQQKKLRIAVLELEPDGVGKKESVTLTNRLRSELVKTGVYTIIERGEMNEILKEQGFQMSGCTSDECAVDAGRLLNVSHIAAGSIGKVGALYTVALRLIDVESGEILKTITEDCQCPIEKVLTHSMRNAALKLSGKMSAGIGVAVLSEGSGDIFIKSNPSRADIYLDNIQTGKTSPVTLQDVAAGKHFIKVVKGEFIGTKSVTVKANEIVNEMIKLEKAKGGLKIYSNPPEAQIFIDGQSHGKTPKVINQLSIGEHQITLKSGNFADFSQTVKVVFNEFTKVNGKLKKLGSLYIKSKPTGAAIYINGDYKGRTPLSVKIVPDKTMDIKLTKDYYEDFKKTLIIKESKVEKLDAKLKKQRGTISLKGLTKGASITINNRKYKINKEELALPVGKYNFEISKPGYVDQSISLTVNSNQTQSIDAALKKKTTAGAVTRSIFIPGWGQGYQGKTARAWIYGLAFGGGLAGSIIYTGKYNTAIDDYNTIYEQYMDATEEDDILRLGKEMESAYDDINSSESMRNILYGVTAGIWLWNVIDAAFLPPAWKNRARLSAVPSKDGMMVGVVYKW